MEAPPAERRDGAARGATSIVVGPVYDRVRDLLTMTGTTVRLAEVVAEIASMRRRGIMITLDVEAAMEVVGVAGAPRVIEASRDRLR